MVFFGKTRLLFLCLIGVSGALFVSALYAHDEQNDNARVARVMKKYASYIDDYESNEKVQKWIAKGEAYADRYTDEQFLDRLVNAEAYRQKDQLAFNNKILYQFDIPLENRTINVALRNGDIGKMLFVLLDWGNEWLAYRNILNCWTKFAVKQFALKRNEYVGALTAMQESIDKGDDQALEMATDKIHKLVLDMSFGDIMGRMAGELLPSMGLYFLVGQSASALQQYYLLDQTQTQNMLTVMLSELFGIKSIDDQKNSVPKPTEVVDFVQRNVFDAMQLSTSRVGLLEQVNSFLQKHGSLPEWRSDNKYLLARRVAFMALFMRWGIKSFLQPKLFEIIINNHQALLETLKTTTDKQLLLASLTHVTNKQDALKTILQDGYSSTFSSWFVSKAEKYLAWQTILNVVLMLPSISDLAQKTYEIIKDFNKKNEAQDNQVGDL